MEFLAKSYPRQTIQEHTLEVLNSYKNLRNLYPDILSTQEWLMLEKAIIFHDLGKLDENFQNKVNSSSNVSNENMENYIYHNFLSGALVDIDELINNFGEKNADTILRAILFHHDRTEPENINDILKKYIAKYVFPNAKKYKFEGYHCPDIFEENNVLDFLKLDISHVTPSYIKIKGLLNKTDYAASAGVEIEQSLYWSGKNVSQMTQSFFDTKNRKLRKLQKYMFENQNDNLIVCAATGSGKTEAALLWIGDCKSFYTLPLKISINAIYQRIQNSANIGYQPALILHSDALSYYINQNGNKTDINEDLNPAEKYSLAKKLSAPLTVCTIDQILKFAYKYNGSELSLATLSYSKLVIDEIQTYSPELLGTIIYSLKMITRLGGKFSIITATFPKMLRKLFKKENIICKYSPPFYGDVHNRHRIAFCNGKEFDFEKIIEDNKAKKVLIIVNTVTRAQILYDMLSEKSGNCRLLHSMYIKKDRDMLEKEILEFAPNSDNKNKQCGIWISTQIVEASLDIDFDVLYTEMCTIDSLLQRMGRVFRSRNYMGEEANVYILNNRNGVKNDFIDEEIYDWSVEAIEHQLNGNKSVLLLESEDCDNKTEMIDYVYDESHCESAYYQRIHKQINALDNLSWYKLDKKEADKIFRNIDSITLCPHKVYQELEDNGKINEWKEKLSQKDLNLEQKQKLKDEIRSYTVNVSYYHMLDYENVELFYKGSRIYLYNGDYDFDGKTGKGIIKQYRTSNKKYDISDLII